MESLILHLERGLCGLGAQGQGLLLAVSGGADSTALLLGCHALAPKLSLRLEVASFDHGLRPEAREEVAQVEALCRRLGVQCHPRKLDVAPGAAVEERARERRYAALESLRRERELALIATAHTASDQAETVLMRLARGASLRGARGILRHREQIIRPLLEVTRAEVERFLTEQKVSWVRDPMNEDLRFARVGVRREVLPALVRSMGPSTTANLARFARLAAEDESYLEEQTDAAYSRARLEDGALSAARVRELPPSLRRRLLARLVQQGAPPGAALHLDGLLMDRLLVALDRGATATLPGDRLLKTTSGVVRCVVAPPRRGAAGDASEAPETQVSPPSGPLRLGDRLFDPITGFLFGIERLDSTPPGAWVVELDAPRAAGELFVRARRPGDRAGSAKLNDLFIDLKIRAEDRDRFPLVVTESGRLVWLVGLWPRMPAEPRNREGVGLFALPESERARALSSRYRLPRRARGRLLPK